jgi:hypothetical protein
MINKHLRNLVLEDQTLKKRVIRLRGKEDVLLMKIREANGLEHLSHYCIASLEKIVKHLRDCGVEPKAESIKITNEFAVMKVMES